MGVYYLALLIFSVVAVYILTSKYKMNPFIVLILIAFLFGLLSGIKPLTVLDTVKSGFGELFYKTGLIYICGIIIGVFLDKTGAAMAISYHIAHRLKKSAGFAMLFSGYVVSIPVNCDSGFIILSPMPKALARTCSYKTIVFHLALAIGLYSTHTFVPPTAGPTTVASVLGVDIGKIILLGLFVSLVSSTITYFIISKVISLKRSDIEIVAEKTIDVKTLPNAFHAILPVAYPLIMICMNSIVHLWFPNSNSRLLGYIEVLGDPTSALLVGAILSMTLVKKENRFTALTDWIKEALDNAALIVLVNSAAGAFAAVISVSPLIDYVQVFANKIPAGFGILLPFIIAALFKTAQGSSTVSMITTASIVLPLISSLGISPEICALSICAGSTMISHTNDSYFWVVSQFSRITVKDTLRYYSTSTALMGSIAFSIILILNYIFKC